MQYLGLYSEMFTTNSFILDSQAFLVALGKSSFSPACVLAWGSLSRNYHTTITRESTSKELVNCLRAFKIY